MVTVPTMAAWWGGSTALTCWPRLPISVSTLRESCSFPQSLPTAGWFHLASMHHPHPLPLSELLLLLWPLAHMSLPGAAFVTPQADQSPIRCSWSTALDSVTMFCLFTHLRSCPAVVLHTCQETPGAQWSVLWHSLELCSAGPCCLPCQKGSYV